MKRVTLCALVVALVVHPLSIVGAEPSTSAAEAIKLCDLMTAAHLDAIAATDISHPDHFVAALLYPHAELLVISARYSTPQALQQLVDQKNYRDVYADLQTGLDASDQVFFIDMKADGLTAGSADAADVMYEPGNKQTVFDESWRKQHAVGEREYLAKYESADALYGSLLKTLSAAFNAPVPTR